MDATAQSTRSRQRRSWALVLQVFRSPRSGFAALRDDSPDAAEARQEPVLAIVILAGIAGVLSTTLAGRLLDEPGIDGLAVLPWAFIGGAFYGLFVYWIGGLLVHALARGLGCSTSYRQARHVVGFAAAPIAASLLTVWPLRIAVYGDDLFRSGGSDTGAGDRVFELAIYATYVWTFGLVALGLLELKRSSSSSGIS